MVFLPGSRRPSDHCGRGGRRDAALLDARIRGWALSPLKSRKAARSSRQRGFQVLASRGWFDKRPYARVEDTLWVPTSLNGPDENRLISALHLSHGEQLVSNSSPLCDSKVKGESS